MEKRIFQYFEVSHRVNKIGGQDVLSRPAYSLGSFTFIAVMELLDGGSWRLENIKRNITEGIMEYQTQYRTNLKFDNIKRTITRGVRQFTTQYQTQ